MTFLKGIKKHNDKDWYDAHKDEYKKLRKEFTQLIEELGQEIATFDPAVAKAQKYGKPTVKIFRIHRDARFAKDKSKYKTNISGFVSADTKNDREPAYYLSVEPGGKSFLGGGLFNPERLALSEIRDKIELHPKKLQTIEHTDEFKRYFPNGLARTRSLKTAPRGHDPEHEAIGYLRLKSFTAGKNIPDIELQKDKLKTEVLEACKTLYQLNKFLRP